MNPDQVLLVFATGGVAKIIQNFNKIQFYKLHLAWFIPIILSLIFCSTSLSFEKFTQASNIYIFFAYLNYLPIIGLFILLFPLEYKYNKGDYFSFINYTIRLRFFFYLLLSLHALFSFPALIFISSSFSIVRLSFLVTLMLLALYILSMIYPGRLIHWFAIIMTVLVKAHYLFIGRLGEYIFSAISF